MQKKSLRVDTASSFFIWEWHKNIFIDIISTFMERVFWDGDTAIFVLTNLFGTTS